MHIVNLLDRGPQDYMTVDALQRHLHTQVATGQREDTLIVWESKDTYTAGRRTQPQDIPNSEIPVISMDRGGSVTYHGPGQLVIYPIIAVTPPKDVVAFVRSTERALIDAMDFIGLKTSQVDGRSGVWILRNGEADRKLCAIGIKFASDTTMHGLAFNVTTDLDRFMQIIPCGLADAGVATLAQEGYNFSLEKVARLLIPYLANAYQPFRREGRNNTELVDDDVAPLLEEVTAGDTTLPQNTGVAWHPRKDTK
ncbi:lipoyl(octanoyl) transferase LipB [Arcanobacterium canis]